MTLPPTAVLRGAQAAAARMADRDTPFVFDDWYVAAFAEEVGPHLLARRLLGRRVVLYRDTAGAVVALDDRCPHRSMPLSAGRLDGDTVVCGYHGMRFNAQGDCIDVPSQPQCPKHVGVRAYPVVERGPVVWIWMGDPAAADLSRLPPQPWLESPDWETSQGFLTLHGSYVRLHENLLDLTHLTFLHEKSIGTPDYAKAPFESVIGDGRFALLRDVVPTTLPPVWADPTGLKGQGQAARIVRSEFLGPGLHEVSVAFYDCHLPADQRRTFHIRTAHMPTPETATTTHYFIVHGRDFAQHDAAMTRTMHDQLFQAFHEDVVGLALQEEALAGTPPDELYEFSIAADAPAVAMRRYLKDRAR
ncbi:aromatic ring-hydroxylating dioxygenase subunit alpha [Aquabacterium sp. J223]|uniref:aromatic ring-hydroxylating dioxygenase subunit alpha n=1 Tax=Aquabacterium sp. J223 TaxID=2898431 RepID=UPI0021AD7D4D|nr:aromatic ring-hydroxylating dioxygenase subunit alpha [Aquabacterium sp. J223]UUX97114.1 aromatic ring-hydroxylating dioxygenase subunit alpha [Aquabacterium sp. J223]